MQHRLSHSEEKGPVIFLIVLFDREMECRDETEYDACRDSGYQEKNVILHFRPP
jgi:hypothetical protein